MRYRVLGGFPCGGGTNDIKGEQTDRQTDITEMIALQQTKYADDSNQKWKQEMVSIVFKE